MLPLGDGPQAKMESLQVTGSFKARGVVTASSGNYGRAVAHVARSLDLTAVVVVPNDAIAAKTDAIVGLGAELLRRGRTSQERLALAMELARDRGLHYVPPFDDPLIIAGAGTAGVELVDQCPEIEAVLVPVSSCGRRWRIDPA